MNTLLVTGSSGLIGSEVVAYFVDQGWRIYGVDNNQRANFFGPLGDTRWNQRRLTELFPVFTHVEMDIRDREGIRRVIEEIRPALIVHAAAQPSHDLAASRPFDDFDVNAVGTLNLLEATRKLAGCRIRPHEHKQGIWRSAELHQAQGTANTLGLRRSELCSRNYGGLPDRSEQTQRLRCQQSGGRHYGAGIRPVFWAEDLLFAWWLPDGTESLGR